MTLHSSLKWGRRLALVAGLGAVAPAWSATGVYVDSPSGDYIGQGQEYTFTDASGSTSFGGTVMTVTFGAWTARFDASMLAAGNYEATTTARFNGQPQAGLDVTAHSRACSRIEGWFEIHEVAFSGNTVVKLAVDLLQSCSGDPPLFGAIRINSDVPLHRPQPYARAPAAMRADEGEVVLLDGGDSFDRESAVSYEWTQVAGTPVTLGSPSAARRTFTAPDVPPGGEELKFKLTVRDSSDNADSTFVTVTVHDPQDLRTRAFLDSDDYDLIGQGLTYRYDESDATFNSLFHTYPATGNSLLILGFDGLEGWRAEFAMPGAGGAPWAPGMYAGAVSTFPVSPTRPGMSVSNSYVCTDVRGWFEIVEIEIVGSTVMRLAVDFVQHCNSNTGLLFGAIRINSNVPLHRQAPYAVAPAIGAFNEGENVTLDGSESTSRDGPVTYQWTQTSGTPVTLTGANSATPSFVAPNVAAGGETLTFVLTVTDANGHTDSTTVTLRIADTSDPRTRAFLDSEPGEFIGQGQTYRYVESDAAIVASIEPFAPGSGLSVSISGLERWGAGFLLPAGAPLVPGMYAVEGANATRPRIFFAGEGRACGDRDPGWFEIVEIEAVNNTVTRLAVDFLQHCGTVALFGAIRINSNVPLDRQVPYAVAPAVVGAFTEGETATLDGSGSMSRHGAMTYQWTQTGGAPVTLTGASSATPSFVAPDVVAGGETLTFVLTVTDANGHADSTTVTLHVADSLDLRTRVLMKSDGGHWVSQGRNYRYNESDATIVNSADTYGDGDPYMGSSILRLNINGLEQFVAEFVLPVGASWAPGMYADATRSSFLQRPAIHFYGGEEGHACADAGWFEIVEIEVAGNTVMRLALDFLHHCENSAPTLFGAIRINSSVPLERNIPFASAGLDQTLAERTAILLDGRRSWSPTGNELNYFWRQTAGPPATILDATSAMASVQAPPGGGDFRFELSVSDGPGRVDVDEIRVVARPGSEAQTYLVVDSDFGDPVGSGEHWFFSADNSIFTVARNNYDPGVNVSIYDGDPENSTLAFAGPNYAQLQPGIYENAQRYSYQSADRPGLYLSIDGTGCYTVSGWFRVLRIAYNPDGSVQTAAIDFEQHCQGATPAARGKLRVNVAPDAEPVANAGPDAEAQENSVAQLDGSSSFDLQGAITYSWRQTAGRTVVLTGADTATPSFSPRALQQIQAPEAYTFVLTVTDAEGFTAEDSVSVEAFSLRDGSDDFDGDGVLDVDDAFSDDPAEHADTDVDGVGDKADTDDDNDGKPDSIELLAPNDGDGNADGALDNLQANVATFIDVTGGLVTVAVGGGATLVTAEGLNSYPYAMSWQGAFDRGFFRIGVAVPSGGAATVEIRLHGASAPARYFMYGPSFGNGTGLYEFAYDGATGAQILADRIVLHLVDGGRGDGDGVENGVITGPSGPDWAEASPGDENSGGGGPMSPWLLAVLAALGALRRPRSRPR